MTPKTYKVERKAETIVVSLGFNKHFVIPRKDAELVCKRIEKACKEARRFLLGGWKGKMHRSTNEGVGWVEKDSDAMFYLYLGKGKAIIFALDEKAALIEKIRDCTNIQQSAGFTAHISG